jgi:hypothetical protein
MTLTPVVLTAELPTNTTGPPDSYMIRGTNGNYGSWPTLVQVAAWLLEHPTVSGVIVPLYKDVDTGQLV